MPHILGKAISLKNGFSIHELFVIGKDGKYVSCGYGVFNPSGELLSSFATPEEAQEELELVAKPKSGYTP